MLTLQRLKRIKLATIPRGQQLLANLVLRFDYRLPRRTKIELVGTENLPDHPVIFAMNHTDRYNYWPFQYQLYRAGHGFTATWVKGKYYENPAIGAFMDSCNNIPLPSRGYVIATEFRAALGRVPTNAEYRLLRDVVDRHRSLDDPLPEDTSADLRGFLGTGDFLARFDRLFGAMMDEVLRLCRSAIEEQDVHLLVFPQGTRSKRLTRGHTGVAQVAQHLGATIIPVGCNGSDRVYPGNSPLARGGRIVYRMGPPLTADGPEFAPHRVPASARPFSHEATAQHGAAYQAITDIVMDRINDLLDPEYQRQEGVEAEATSVSRFIE
ncbi:MAG: lysophospholipid acyltransferase family protein [Myxococcota bacterium]